MRISGSLKQPRRLARPLLVLTGLMLGGAALVGASPASAHVAIGFGFGVPVYYGPPVVYGPPPVYYPPPPPYYYYYYPPPAMAAPATTAAPDAVTPLSGSAGSQQQCREYQATTTINGVAQPSYGTACLQPDGTWRLVN